MISICVFAQTPKTDTKEVNINPLIQKSATVVNEWQPDEFIIMSFCDPILYDSDDRDRLIDMKNAGFNTLSGLIDNDNGHDYNDAVYIDNLIGSIGGGLNLLVSDFRHLTNRETHNTYNYCTCNGGNSCVNPTSKEFYVQKPFSGSVAKNIVQDYSNLTYILGYHLADEPTLIAKTSDNETNELARTTEWINYYEENDPERVATVNLFGIHNNCRHGDYQKYVEAYFDGDPTLEVNTPGGSNFVMFDKYPLKPETNNEGIVVYDRSYYKNCRIMAEVTTSRNAHFLSWILSNDMSDREKRTLPIMRYTAHIPVAYGASGIGYWTYDHVDGYGNGILDENYNIVNNKYNWAKNINRKLINAGKVIIDEMKWITTLHGSDTDPISKEENLAIPGSDNAGHNLITSISEENFCVGTFKATNQVGDENKQDYYLVVVNKCWNPTHEKNAKKVDISFNGNATIDSLNRTVTPALNPSWVTYSNKKVVDGKMKIEELEIDYGDMVVIRLKDFDWSLNSVTNGEPKEDFQSGKWTDEVTSVNNWRWSEKYFGFDGIEGILEITDQCKNSHTYVYGENSGDLIEYLMEFGGDYSQLVLRGIADQPAPVMLRIYVDGQAKATTEWDDNDLCNDLAFIKIDDIEYGTHAIAIEYINDLYDPANNIDRNFYLDALMVISTEAEGIPVFVGDDILGIVSDNPEGTTFIIKATDWHGNKGIHRMQQINPKDGNRFIGENGAVLSGAMELNQWQKSGDLWVHAGPESLQNSEIYHFENCIEINGSKIHCDWPEDLYFDNQFCQKLSSLAQLQSYTVSAGDPPAWFFDRDNTDPDRADINHGIYIKTDPSAYNWELSYTLYAFGGERVMPDWKKYLITDPATIAKNVTINGLVIEKYACPGQMGAIGLQDPGVGWTIEDNEVRLNHGAGINAGSGNIVKGNYVHDNGQIGIKASREIGESTDKPEDGYSYFVEDVLIDQNKITLNGKDEVGYEWLWEGGGTKFSKTTNLTARNNIVQKNRGAGLWTDIDNTGTIFENNIVEDNLDNGIFHEISGSAIIRNNISRRNGAGRSSSSVSGKFQRAQIQVSTSHDVEVYNNTVDAGESMNGIIVRYDYRDEKGPDNLYYSSNVKVHHNQIIVPEENDLGISGGWINTINYQDTKEKYWKTKPEPLSSTGHNFDFDVYQLANSDKNRWVWENGDGSDQILSFEEFQAVKQELNGLSSGALAMYFNDGSKAYTSTLIHPVVIKNESQISFTWGGWSPDDRIGSRVIRDENNFSARYEGSLKVEESAYYQLRLSSDDGIRLLLKDEHGTLVSLEQWEDAPANTVRLESGTLFLEKDKNYPFRIEYYRRGIASQGNAWLSLEWKKGGGDYQVVPAEAICPPTDLPGYGLQGSYYDAPEDIETENIKLVRTDQQINFNWSHFTPDSRIEEDGDFAIIWEGKLKPLYNDDYYFFIRYNYDYDDIKFYFDGVEYIDEDNNHRYEISGLKEGTKYDIRIEYRKNSGDHPSNEVLLEWESATNGPQDFQVVPSYCLYPPDNRTGPDEFQIDEHEKGISIRYFNMKENALKDWCWQDWPSSDSYPHENYIFWPFMGIVEEPVKSHATVINFNWHAGSPDYRIGADYFSSYIVGSVSLPRGEVAGEREFLLETDDGGILSIAGGPGPVVDTWTNKDAPNTGTFYMEPNYNYSFYIKHYERGGGASAKAVLKWRYLTNLKNKSAAEEEFSIVPPSALQELDEENPMVINVFVFQPDTILEQMEDNEDIELERFNDGLDILAETLPFDPAYVTFELDGTLLKTVSSPPFLLLQSYGDVDNWPPDLGTHTLTITPYSSSGTSGNGQSIQFNVFSSSSTYHTNSYVRKIYPNPTRNNLFLELNYSEQTIVKIHIENILGQTVYFDKTIAIEKLELNTSLLPEGVYILKIETDTWEESVSFIKVD